MKKLLIAALIGFSISMNISSCKPDGPEPAKAQPGEVNLSMNHVFGANALKLFDNYTNAAGNELQIHLLRYYLSNIVLHNSNGSDHKIDYYHIVDASDMTTLNINLKDIPAGSYNGISMIIGVDSARNHTGAQTGALDPLNNMFWTWNSGYIFIKVEGKVNEGGNFNGFSYHIGLDSSKVMFSNLPLNGLDVNGNSKTIKMEFDASEIFKNPIQFDITTEGKFTKTFDKPVIADKLVSNLADCIKVTKVE